MVKQASKRIFEDMNKFCFLKKKCTEAKPRNMFFIRPNDALRVISVACCQTGGQLFRPLRVWANGRETTDYVIRPTKSHMHHESRQRHLSSQVLSTACKSCGCTSCLVHSSNLIKGLISVYGNDSKCLKCLFELIKPDKTCSRLVYRAHLPGA